MTLDRKELLDLLINVYELEESSAKQIVEDLSNGRELMEWETLLLESHEVPSHLYNLKKK